MEETYLGIDDKGKEYEVTKPDFDNMTALCKSEEWMGSLRCAFKEIRELPTQTQEKV